MNKQIITRVLLAIFALLIVLLIVVQIVNSCQTGMTTETATAASVTNSIKADNSVVIRNETYVKNDNGGVLSYEVSNGTKVSKGGTIAYVFSDSDAAANETKRLQLKKDLGQLEALKQSAKQSSANPDSISKNIYQKMYTLKQDIANGSLYIESDKDDLLSYINQWNLIVGNDVDLDSRIDQIKAEVSSLDNTGQISKIKSDYAGFFITDVDGYEGSFDYSKAKELTVADLTKQLEKQNVPENVIGKVCEGFTWYIGCVVNTSETDRLKVGQDIKVELPYVVNSAIPAEIVAINKEDDADKTAVILKCTNMDESIATARDAVVYINLENYNGIRVSQKAIHFQTVSKEITDEKGKTTTVTNEVPGVYKVTGNKLKFVQIVSLYSNESYVICDANPSMDDLLTDETVQLYDTIAIGGDDLYDGKPIL